jgi:guanylate kinase
VSETQQPGILVLSGPAGSGKTTVVNRLLSVSPAKLMKCISATTRPPRPEEVNSSDYYFLSTEEFEQRRERGEFLECAEVHKSGNWYGTLKSEIERARNENAWAFLEIDVEGALNVMQAYPQAVTIFLTTPNPDDYERRLRERNTESEEVIQKRLQTAREELKHADRYRFCIVNDELARTIDEINDILKSEEDVS